MGGYTYVLSEVASTYAFALPRRDQQRLAHTCRTLAARPQRSGDYTTRDTTGRILQNLLIDDWVITYWFDHGVKELRITEIVQV